MTPRQKAAAVVAAWFLGNAVLCGILYFFHERWFAIILFSLDTLLPAIAAAAVLLLPARNERAEVEFELSGASPWVPALAFGIVLVAIGSIFGTWFIIIGSVLTLVAAERLLHRPRRPVEVRVSEGVPGGHG